VAISVAELEATVTAETSDFDSKMSTSGQAVDDLGTKSQGASANFGAASAAMAAGAAGIGVGIADAVGAAGDFQSSVNEIGAVSGATAGQLTQLSDMALKVGQDTSFSAQQGADAISELAKAGVGIPDILGGAAMATADLAAAAGEDMPTAATQMSNAMNMFQISGDQATTVADTLAAAANASSADVSDLAYGMAQAGPSAAGLGLSLQETVAQLALFSNYGLQGSDAGTSFKTMLTNLIPQTKAQHEEFAALGLSTTDVANKFFDAQGHFVGMEAASKTLYDALAPLTDEQRKVAEQAIFGSDASRAAEITFQAQKAAVEGTGEGYKGLLDAVQPAGQATEVANARMAGMNGALESLSGSVDTAKIAFGSAFLPVVEQVADRLTNLVNVFIGLPAPVQQAIAFVVAGAAAFLAVGAAIGFVVGPAGAAVAALTPVALGIAAIAAPLALVVAGLAALKVAYDQNLGGFADAVNQAATDITQALQPILTVVAQVAQAFQTGGLQAAMSELVASMPAITGALGNLAGVLGDLAARAIPALVDAFRNLPWQEIGNAIGAGLQGALSALSSFGAWVLNAIQGGAGGGGGAGNLAAELGGWIRDRVSEIDWGQVGTALLAGAQRAAALLLDFSQWGLDRLGEIATWALAAITGADWAGISATLQTKGQDFVTGLLAGIQSTSAQLFAWFNAVGPGVLGAVGDVASLLTSKGADLLTGLLSGLTTNWPAISAWLANAGATILTALGDLATLLIPKGADLLTGFLSGLTTNWPAISTWLGQVGATALTAIGDLLALLVPKGGDLLAGLLQGITTKWPEVQTWLATVGPIALTAVGDLAATLLTKGVDLLAGVLAGLTQKWPDIQAWLATVGATAITAIGDLAGTLLPAGGALISGLFQGITDKWPDVNSWLLALGQDAADTVGDLSPRLVDHGTQLITGLYTAATAFWDGTAAPWLTALPGNAASAVGDLAATLAPAGTALLTGLSTGALDVWNNVLGPWLQSTPTLVSGAVGDLSATLTAAGSALLTSLSTGALDIWNNVLGPWLQGLPGMIVGAVGDLSGVLFSAGQAVGQGLVNGITSMIGSVTDAAGQLASAIPNNVGSVLGIKSPSTVLRAQGIDAGQGLVNGLQASLPAVGQAATDLGSQVVTKFRDIAAKIRQVGTDSATNFWQGMLTQVPKTIEAAQFIAEQAAAAAHGAVAKAQAAAGGTQLQIQVLQAQQSSLAKGSPELAANQAQIEALTATFNQQQLAMTATQQQQTSARIKELQKEIAAASNPQKKQELRAELLVQQQQLGVLDQLQAAQTDLASASGDAAKEIAQIKVDSLTSQLTDLQQFDPSSFFTTMSSSVADSSKKMKDHLKTVGDTGVDQGKKAGAGMVDGVKAHQQDFGTAVKGTVDAGTSAGTTAANGPNGSKTVGTSFVNSASGGLNGATGFKDAATSMVGGGLGAASDAVANGIGSGNNRVNSASGIGFDFANDFANGILGQLGTAQSAGYQLYQAAAAGARGSAAGTTSVSTASISSASTQHSAGATSFGAGASAPASSGAGTSYVILNIDTIEVADGHDFVEIVSNYAHMTHIAAGRGAS
jgi:TP901 family phage tail tape measure protein